MGQRFADSSGSMERKKVPEMNLEGHALLLASEGFYVFPLAPRTKIPLKGMTDWAMKATRSKKVIKEWWEKNPECNIGVFTGKFRKNQSLVVVDIDVKNGKDGFSEIIKLEFEGWDFPPTMEVETTSGGRHLIYTHSESLRGGTDRLARGVDICSTGAYIVGWGSIFEGKVYQRNTLKLIACPKPMAEFLGKPRESRLTLIQGDLKNINKESAIKRAVHYLEYEAPISIIGNRGDDTAYLVAARVKDMGIDPQTCLGLMWDHWNERCPPCWPYDELSKKVENAYQYGKDPIGVSAPELQFTPVPKEEKKTNPFEEINKNHAFIMQGSDYHILWETVDDKGKFDLRFLKETAFHKMYKYRTLQGEIDPKNCLTKKWMNSDLRRSYKGICFRPDGGVSPDFYNLWSGFAVEKLGESEEPTPDMKLAVDDYLLHIKEDACNGDEDHYKWLVSYLAHMVQKPAEKPHTALVFRGEEGTGKNAIIDRMGEIFGQHALAVADEIYLTGQFTGHLQNKVLMTMNESFWAGNKSAESKLKSLITEKTQVIRCLYQEPYTVDNCLRLCICSNEQWVVPASAGARRFAVFNFGNKRKEDHEFFRKLNERMDNGGLRYLLTYLLNYDLTGFNVNSAPKTEGLYDQQMVSLSPFEMFWHNCLQEKRIVCSDFGEKWPEQIDKIYIQQAFRRYCKENNISSRFNPTQEGMLLKKICRSVTNDQKRWEKGSTISIYRFKNWETCWEDWEHCFQRAKKTIIEPFDES